MLAPIHPRQSERLAAIRRYDLGSRVHEGAFAGLVELAAQACNCPIALVSIVRESDQHFEAACGLDAEGAGLEASICSHAILGDDILEVSDCREDERTRDNPLVTDRDDPLLFYAGAPIVTSDGVPLGSLCVLDRRPRRLGDQERRALQLLSGQVMRQLELHEALRQQEALRREVDHRVKNNLANVAVLTRMAARGARGDEARIALGDVERRIRVMAELHADLYRVEAPDASIELSGYLRRIIGHLTEIAPRAVTLDGAFAPLELGTQQAAALGIAVNELVSNACRHAFPDDRSGRIQVTGRAREDGHYEIVCADDGVGAGVTAADKLGQRIVDASVSQIDGTVRRGDDADGGHAVRIVFPLPGG
ncbi:MAG: histidine kinase dimerization/phosphoacceptor domain -containing protein [Pseudomonadota bacterium]